MTKSGRRSTPGERGDGSGDRSQPETPPRRPWRRIRWQGFARFGLALGLIGFGTVVAMGVRERVEPVTETAVDRADPEAIIESVGAELLQTAEGLENFTIKGARQLTYENGAVRFVGGVELAVADQPDRESFVVTGTDASVDSEETDATITGDVLLEVSDGLVVRTGSATYATERGRVTMHDESGLTTLSRSGLEAAGRRVVYERDRAIVNLHDDATVRLTADDARAALDIRSARATLAHADSYMHFDGGAEALTGDMVLGAAATTAYFGEEETALERLELRGEASIRATTPVSGGLRDMRADEMTLAFEEAARVLERVVLTGASRMALVGADDARGARISAEAMEVELADGDVVSLEALDGVRLELPATSDGARQQISAGSLSQTGAPAEGPTGVVFERDVEYRERRAATPTSDAVDRLIAADRLEAGLEHGLSVLLDAQFVGGVRFEDATRRAEADEAVYDITAGEVTLSAFDEATRSPTLYDGTARIEAARIVLTVDGAAFEATDGVKTVLTRSGDETSVSDGETTPGLLQGDEQISITADELLYDGQMQQATYSGLARLWQGETSFQGDSLILDDASGNLSADGSVRTTIQLIRHNETTQRLEPSLTRVVADTFRYDNATHVATYDTQALLDSGSGDLKLAADTIEVFLETDGQSLDRLEATGEVKLLLGDRWATGERLVYYEATGQYEMVGAPVEIVEEVEPEEPITPTPRPRPGAPPPAPTCRSTRGRVLTFFRSTDKVVVDGREELRTESAGGTCTPLTF